MKSRLVDSKPTAGLGPKSSAYFVSGLITKPSFKEFNVKQSINYSKVVKPSINSFAKYLKKPKDPEQFLLDESSCTDLHLQLSAFESFLLSDQNNNLLMKLHSLVANLSLSPNFLLKLKYQAEKFSILKKSLEKKQEMQKEIERIAEENRALERKINEINESETQDGSENESSRIEEVLINILEKKTISAASSDLSNAIIEEFANFKLAKTKTAIQRIHKQIVEFFGLSELESLYNEIIEAISKRVLVEIAKKKKRNEEHSIISKHHFETRKVFETLKCYETGATMASMF